MVNQLDIQPQNPQSDNSLPPSAVEQPAYATTGLMLNALQATATELYKLGFNVFPVPFAQKGGWPWKQFQYTRIHPEQLPILFWDRCNPAVMTGRTSGNLFIIDCETRQAFEEQGALLRQHHIPIWAVRSGGEKGGGHYYLRCAEGEIANIRSGTLPDMEVRGNRCYVLAPPAVHPATGGVYQWLQREGDLPPLVSRSDLPWLPLKLAARAKSTARQVPTAFSELSQTSRDFILHGAPQGTRNNRLFAAACDMVGNQYDDFTITQTLTPIAKACGLSRQEIQDTLNSAMRKSREPSRKSEPLSEQPFPHVRATAWAEQRPWPGRTGQTDRAVFLACCERARVASNDKGVFRASVREIGDLARVNKETASTSLLRLQKAGLITFEGLDRTSRARLWRLSPHTAPPLRHPYTSPTWSSNSVRIMLASDASEHGALGKVGALVYAVLLDCKRPMMPKALARRALLSLNQVQRALAKLKDYTLVRREHRGWVGIPRDVAWLDQHVAARAGTLGKGERRRTRHAEERAWYAGNAVIREQAKARRRRQVCEEAVVSLPAADPPPEPARHGTLYCSNCGQSVFVFEGLEPPTTCHFCAENYNWKRQPTLWLPRPPESAPHRRC